MERGFLLMAITETKTKYTHTRPPATFTKLLAINIDANRYSERSRRRLITGSAGRFSSPISFRSPGVREKNATSEADTKPETNSSKKARLNAITGPAVSACTVTFSNKPDK